METEAETGRRWPPAQGRTPGAPRSWKRWGGPSPGASGWSSALGLLDLRRLVPRTRGGWMSVVLSHDPIWHHLFWPTQDTRTHGSGWIGTHLKF